MSKKVLVAMSGGVDSSYSAILLKEEGYDIVGVTFKINDSNTTKKSIDDAKYICSLLNIKHIVVDYKDIFFEKVISDFIEEYKNGKTPNPCVLCNKYIKFLKLNELRKELHCDFVATGHYAKIIKDDKNYYIKKAHNISKDQTYFLNQVSSELLPYFIFPLGNVESKEEVRSFLKARNIEIAEKKESQEICFIEKNNLRLFLNEYIPLKKGNIVDENENILGIHEGSFLYTIGQRKGLGVSNNEKRYVLKIDSKNNKVYLGEENKLYSDILDIKDINIISKNLLLDQENLYAKVRYGSKESKIKEIKFDEKKGQARVIFFEKQKSITPGQYLVIYYEDILVLGGKII